MTRIEQFRGRSGNTVEVRYQTDEHGVEFLDEIVTDTIHIEVMDEGGCWADIDGLRVNWGAKRRGRLIFCCDTSELALLLVEKKEPQDHASLSTPRL